MLMRIYLCLITLFFACPSIAQVAGSVLDPASPAINPLDPNGDGFISSTGTAFTGPYDETEFELPFIPIQQYEAEPGSDNQYSAGCEFYELVNDPSSNADAGYYYHYNPDGIPDNGDELMFFRFRVARFSNGATAFSMLIDTDYLFGFSGPEADPNAVVGNPGFEKEVAIFNNTGATGGVRVFNVDGTSNPSVVNYQAPVSTHYQVSYALNRDAGCTQTPVFVDMWVPFSALGISSALQIRIAVAVNEDIDSSLGGGASDIGGVDGNVIQDDDQQFIAAITNFSPIAVIDPANRAPVGVDGSFAIDENSAAGTPVHTVSAADSNGDALTWSIESGNIGGAFALDPGTGAIQVNNPGVLDFEALPVFTLVVRVSDGRLYDRAIITIQLKDVNEPPSVQDAGSTVNEHSPDGFVILAVAGTDPDVNAVLTYSISGGNAQDLFSINPATGEISVKNDEALDFETSTSHVLTIQVTDGAFSDMAVITIQVTDVNEAPTVSSAAATLDENTADGSSVVTITGSDPDAGTVLQFSITDGNIGNAFAIDEITGIVTVNNSLSLDFETVPVFALTVSVSDGSLTSDTEVTITLRNINEPPAVQDALIEVEVRRGSNDAFYTVVAGDPDAGDVLAFTLEVSDGHDLFFVDPVTGEIRITDMARLTVPSLSARIVVVATDQGGLSGRGTIEITIVVKRERSDIVAQKGFSPDGDNQNDFWFIRGIDAFPDNTVQVFNRWGLPVYEVSGYNNESHVWRGEVNGSPGATENTYFYIIRAADFEPITGYVIVKP